jgi:hypothetical protein
MLRDLKPHRFGYGLLLLATLEALAILIPPQLHQSPMGTQLRRSLCRAWPFTLNRILAHFLLLVPAFLYAMGKKTTTLIVWVL